MNKPAMRIVNTSAEDLKNCNVEHIVRVFGQISQQPGSAKSLRGLVFLGFPSVETDQRPNWFIEDVRCFIRKLDNEMPHFCYFLTSDPPFGFLRTYLYCLLDIDPNGMVNPQSFEPLIRRLEQDIRGFCDRIADRPEPVIEKIMISLPARIVHNVPPLRRAALRSLLPILEAIVRSPDVPDSFKGSAFREAEELLGTNVSACGGEMAFITQVREEAGKED